MAEPVTWAAVGMAAVSNVATWLTIIASNKKAKANGNGKKPCQEHDRRLTTLEVDQKNTAKAIENLGKENREDHKEIFKLLRGQE